MFLTTNNCDVDNRCTHIKPVSSVREPEVRLYDVAAGGGGLNKRGRVGLEGGGGGWHLDAGTGSDWGGAIGRTA
jgi:hypothetical protein